MIFLGNFVFYFAMDPSNLLKGQKDRLICASNNRKSKNIHAMTTVNIAMNQRERYQSQVCLCKMNLLAHGESKLQWLNVTFA